MTRKPMITFLSQFFFLIFEMGGGKMKRGKREQREEGAGEDGRDAGARKPADAAEKASG